MKGHHKSNRQWNRGHYTVASTWLAGLAVVLFTVPALAIDDHTSFADTHIDRAAMRAETSTILVVADNSKKETTVDAPYNPMVSYPGKYEADQLYRKNLSTGAWKVRSHPAHLKDVNCFEAKAKLGERGLWKGNLNQDGSCEGSGEASDWAVGNFLNFQFQENMNTTDTEGETE